jgi:hypothetical protein
MRNFILFGKGETKKLLLYLSVNTYSLVLRSNAYLGAVLRSRSIFVRLQLVINFGSGSSLSKISALAPTIFPIFFRKK